MKVTRKDLIIWKQEIVTTMEDYINEFKKIWFYTRNDRRRYYI